jgi:hypothetical protein
MPDFTKIKGKDSIGILAWGRVGLFLGREMGPSELTNGREWLTCKVLQGQINCIGLSAPKYWGDGPKKPGVIALAF